MYLRHDTYMMTILKDVCTKTKLKKLIPCSFIVYVFNSSEKQPQSCNPVTHNTHKKHTNMHANNGNKLF